MAVTINGTTGVAVPLGSASSPAETNTTSATTGIYYPTSTTLGLSTNGTNAVTIDASQNVTAMANLTLSGTAARITGDFSNATLASRVMFQSSTANAVTAISAIPNGSGTVSTVNLYNANSFTNYAYAQLQINAVETRVLTGAAGSGTALPLTFYTQEVERMRIDTSGNLLVGKTSSSAGVAGLSLYNSSGTAGRIDVSNTSGASQYAMGFYYSATPTNVGNITINSTTTSYNTSSDYRLKENVQPITSGLAIVSALKPVTYDWVGTEEKGEGFIAHELQEHIPLAVTGEKDAVNEDGSIKPQGVDYSKIVVHLVAAIQELSAEVEALKAKVGA